MFNFIVSETLVGPEIEVIMPETGGKP